MAGAISRAPDISIMNDDRGTVCRRMDVKFDAVDADGERVPERAERIFRVNCGRSAVGIDLRHLTALPSVGTLHASIISPAILSAKASVIS
jgi:hypothetical protein